MKTTTRIIILFSGLFLFFIGYYILSLLKPSQEPTLPPNQPTPIPPSLTVTPTDIVTASPPSAQQSILPRLTQLIPFDSNEFSIEYYNSTQAFVVTIKESPFEKNKKKAQNWFHNHGVTNLSDLKIIYTSYRWVE